METVAQSRGLESGRQVAVATVRELVSSRAAGPDLLRALAILLVMLWHLPAPATPAFLHEIKRYGWTGVDLFFVLSGYLIGTQLLSSVAHKQRLRVTDFYLKRSLRILPAFFTVLGLYVCLPGIRESEVMQAAWRFLTFSMNFGLDYRFTGAFTQAWSLCVEEHFYLVLPLLVLLMTQLRWRGWTVLLACGVLFGGMALRAVLWQSTMDEPLASGATDSLAPLYLKAIYYPTYCRLDGLLFGVLLAALKIFKPDQWRRYADPRISLAIGIFAIALAVAVFHYPTTPAFGGPLLTKVGATIGYPLFSLGCVLILAASLEWERVFGTWRVPGAGTIAILSYSIYLTHKLTIHADQTIFGEQALAGTSGLFIYFATSIAAAALLWLMVERPFLILRARIFSRRSR